MISRLFVFIETLRVSVGARMESESSIVHRTRSPNE